MEFLDSQKNKAFNGPNRRFFSFIGKMLLKFNNLRYVVISELEFPAATCTKHKQQHNFEPQFLILISQLVVKGEMAIEITTIIK